MTSEGMSHTVRQKLLAFAGFLFGAPAAANPQQINITFPTPSLVTTRVGHGMMSHCGSSLFTLYSLMRQGRALFYRRIPVPCSLLQSNMCCRDLLFTKL